MSKLPETTDLPHAGEGYDPARVEEAFAAFGERVRELEAVAAELRDEVRALRGERAAPPPPAPYDDRWAGDPVGDASPEWVAAVPPPAVRDVAVPRLVVEGAFLLAVAVLAGLADLSAPWIVGVMVAAWVLVALAEWAAAAKRARWRLEEIAPAVPRAAGDTTGPWDMPVVEATVVAAGPDPESKTIVAKLPAPVEPAAEQEAEADADQVEPKRRRFARLRRKQPVEAAAAADPWER
jgi:hypothetical protein